MKIIESHAGDARFINGGRQKRKEKRDVKSPWQSELEVPIRWAVFKHLDLDFFPTGRVILVLR